MTGIPASIGRYKIVSRLGRGGMGTLYLAFDPRLERQIAIKILLDDDDELRERFSREARSAARLHHPNIVTMYDVGEDDGRPFMAMEYIQGQTLADIIRKREPLTTVRKLQLIEALVDGLGFAHKSGVIHRDVKPANIMVDVGGALKILDFGIARIAESSSMTRAGAPIGTLNYMSPEQLGGQNVDQRADIFSVGALSYELMSYRQAFPGGLDTGILQRLLHGEIEPLATICPGLDPEIIQIIERCLSVDIQRRYQDLETMRRDVVRVLFRLSVEEPRVDVPLDHPAAGPEPGTGSTPAPRRAVDRAELAKRRARQIQTYLKTARAAFAGGDFETAITECERVLLLDAEQTEAIELADRARDAVDDRQANAWLTEAESDIQRGELTLGVSKIDQALALSPSLPRAAEVRERADAAIRVREEARRRAEAIQATLERARASFDHGLFADAVAATDEVLALDAEQADARLLKAQALKAIDDRAREELARRAREAVQEARRQFDKNDHNGALDRLARFEPKHEIVTQALEAMRAEAEHIAEQRRLEAERQAKRARIQAELASAAEQIERREYVDALDRLYALLAAEGDSPAISALIQSAEAGQAELDRAAELADKIAESMARAAGLFARNDFAGALTRVEQALTLDPRHAPALALRTKIQDGLRIAAERQQTRERRAREREESIADAIEEIHRATSHETAIDACYRALQIDPDNAEVQKLLRERQERVEREGTERYRKAEVERARLEAIQRLLDSAREALRRGDPATARRDIRKVREVEPESAEAQWLWNDMVATHGEPPPEPPPPPPAAPRTQPAASQSATTSARKEPRTESKPAPPSPRLPADETGGGFSITPMMALAIAGVIVVVVVVIYFALR